MQPVKQSAETYVSISEITRDDSNVPPLEADVKESAEILLDSPESSVADIIPLSELQHVENMENQEPTSQQNADDSTQSKPRAKSNKSKPVTTGALRDLSKELSSISSERNEEYDKPLTTGELLDLSQDLSSIKKEQSKRDESEVIDAVPMTDELPPPHEIIPETAIAHYKPSPQSGHALRYTAITAASAIIVISSVLLIRHTLYSNNQTNGEVQQADRSTPPPREASPTPTLAVALPSPTPEITTPTPAPATPTPTPTPVIISTPTPVAISKIITPEKPKSQVKPKRVDKKPDVAVSKPLQADAKPRPARSGVPTPAPTIFERFKPKN